MKVGKLILGALVVGAAAYGVAFLIRQRKLLSDSTFSLANISPQSVTLSRVSVNADVVVTNKSDVTFTIYGGMLKTSVNGNPLADIAITDKKTLPANGGTASFPVNATFNPVDVLQNVGSALSSMTVLDLNKLIIGIKGNMAVSSGKILFNSLPVDMTFTASEILSNK